MDMSQGVVSCISFDYKKALEALLYIVTRVEKPTAHDVSKFFYWADKIHLQKYGRQLFDDSYIAMKNGPVPSGVYDMIKFVRGDGIFEFPSDVADAFEVYDRFCIRAKRGADERRLSKSEKDAIDASIAENRNLNFDQKTKKSHDAAYDAAIRDDTMSLESIVKTLPNSTSVWSYINSKQN